MMNTKKTSIIFASALMFSAAAAFAEGDAATVEKQTSFLQKLDSLNQSILGLRLGGTAKAGALTSMASSDQFSDISPTQENQAYTDVNLRFLAQPSSETRLDVQLRLHKDWQSGVDENNNPAIGHWFSYDGNILNNHVDFNLGYMRVGYTPLTINTPQVEILQEPEIFTQNRIDALAARNLDTTSRRLMQGLNAAFHSGAVGAVDNIYVQMTGARMRNTAKKNDQVFFDFDWADRYAYGTRGGLELFGANLGANFVGAFDRRLTTRSRDLGLKDSIHYESNEVLSVELGFNSKKMMPSLPVVFGLNAEYAMSWWDSDVEFMQKYPAVSSQLKEEKGFPDGEGTRTVVYVSATVDGTASERVTVDEADADGSALFVQGFAKGSFSKFNFDFKGSYLMNDEKFWSELASSPNYLGNGIIFNANALYGDVDQTLVSDFASGNLENLYFMVYNTDLLTASTLMSSGSATARSSKYTVSQNMYNRLYNNFKLAHFYRNAYDANTMKMLEVAEAVFMMDPSVNLAMPLGLATPNRKGFAVSLDADWDDAITLNGRFSQYSEQEGDNKYTTIGAGLGVDVGRLVPSLGRKLLVQGSFEKTTEDSYLKRSAQRIVGGLTADIWGPFALQAGVQMLNKKFEGDAFGLGVAGLPVGTSFVQAVDEMLILAGPKVRIAPQSYLTVRYGMLKNTVDYKTPNAAAALDATLPPYVDKELSIDKNLITAEVTVNF